MIIARQDQLPSTDQAYNIETVVSKLAVTDCTARIIAGIKKVMTGTAHGQSHAY